MVRRKYNFYTISRIDKMQNSNKIAKRRFTCTAYLVLIICTMACVSSRERDAFLYFNEVKRASYPYEDITPTHTDLPALDESSTLADYLAYAALNNPGLRAAFDQWKAALEKIPQDRSLPDPRFNYTYFIKEVETRVGPQQHKFGLSQTFPWLSKLTLRGDMATEAANVMQQNYEAVKLRLFFRVKKSYYEYYYLARAIAITRENVELVKYLEGVARARYRAGAEAYANVIKAQVELGTLIDRVKTLQDLRDPIIAELNAALNRPPEAPLPRPQSVSEMEITCSQQDLIDWLSENNPELKAKDFEIAQARTGIDLAKKNYFPDITLGAEYVDTDDALNPTTPDSGKDPVMAMISVNIPIWYGRYRAAEQEARAQWQAAKQSRVNAANNLYAAVKMAFYTFRDAKRKINLYKHTLIPKGDESLKVTQMAFETGKVDFINLIDAQRILLEFRLAYERALADHAQSLAKLEILVGRELAQGPQRGP